MAGNKVKFNLKNVHYAVKGESGYGTPVHIPGAVSIALSAQGNTEKFYADGVAYYVATSNQGYEGDLELALLPDSFRKDVFGDIEDSAKVLIENQDAKTKEFALGFQIDGDVTDTHFWYYGCTAARPSVNANTNEESKTPQTDSLTVTVAGDNGVVRAKTTAESTSSVIEAWYEAVYVKTA